MCVEDRDPVQADKGENSNGERFERSSYLEKLLSVLKRQDTSTNHEQDKISRPAEEEVEAELSNNDKRKWRCGSKS
jgi:hypothetical protein